MDQRFDKVDAKFDRIDARLSKIIDKITFLEIKLNKCSRNPSPLGEGQVSFLYLIFIFFLFFLSFYSQ